VPEIKRGHTKLGGCAEEAEVCAESREEVVIEEEDGVGVEVGSVHIKIIIDCWWASILTQ
jgi:hypothetical protein